MAESNIMDRCVLLQVSVSSFGVKRKLPTSKIDAGDANKTFLHVSKDLIKSERYTAIRKADGDFRTWLTSRCLPSLFKEGIYLLPIDLIEEVDAEIQKYTAARQERIDRFLEEYPDKRDEAETELGSCFDASQYPEPMAVRATFGVVTRYLSFSTPGNLRGINKDIFDRETQKLKETIASAQEEIQTVLRAGFSELVTHLIDRLSPDATGKQKVFRDSLIGNVRDFMANFAARNITDDAELAALVDQAREIIEGVDPQTLRDHRGVRNTVREALADVKSTLDEMLVDKPGRKIAFEDMQGEATA
jgi:hypothetical protein